jgi:hypothetical protein
MAKKSRRKDQRESAPKGTARRTLRAARHFFDKAGQVEHNNTEDYGYFVEAAIVFAWMVLEHLEREKPDAEKWIKNLVESKPSLDELKKQRNLISHQRSITTTSSPKDVLYYGEQSPETKEAYESLRDQLIEIETIVDQCERQFK